MEAGSIPNVSSTNNGCPRELSQPDSACSQQVEMHRFSADEQEGGSGEQDGDDDDNDDGERESAEKRRRTRDAASLALLEARSQFRIPLAQNAE